MPSPVNRPVMTCSYANAATLAQHVAGGVVTNAEEAYRFVYLYGPTAVGKTTLLSEIQRKIGLVSPEKKVKRFSLYDFTENLSDAVKEGRVDAFRTGLTEDCDVLLLDDLHFLEGKAATQEELARILDALLAAGKRVVLAGEKPLYAYAALDARMASRIAASTMVAMEYPDFDTLAGLAKSQLLDMGIPFDPAVPDRIAEVTGNLAALQGAMNQIRVQEVFRFVPLTKNNIDSILAGRSE